MILESIEIAGFRGLRDFKHSFERGKALVVYGLNGTGKSSLFQALTFVITGQFPLVSSVGDLSPTVYRHKALDNNTSAYVHLSFEHNSKKYWIKREINYTGNISTTFSDKDAVDICQQSKNIFCFLTKKEFVSMVDAVEKDSWKRMSPFLGHEYISKFREGLRILNNNIKKDLQLSAIEEMVSKEKILMSEAKNKYDMCLQQLGLEKFSFETIKQELSRLIDTSEINNFDEIPWEQLESKLPGGERIKIITKQIQEISHEAAITKISNVQSKEFQASLEFMAKLHNNTQLAHDLLHEKFFSIANSTVDSLSNEPCPLCGLVPDNWGEVRKNLNTRIEELKTLRSYFDTAKKCFESYKPALNVVIEALDGFFGEHSPREELSDYYEKIKGFRDFIELAIERLEAIPPLGFSQEELNSFSKIKQNAVDSYLVLKARLDSVEKKLKEEQKKIAEAPELQRFYKLKELTSAFVEFAKAVRRFKISTKRVAIIKEIIEKLQNFFKLVDEAESNLSAQLITDLATEVIRIFGIITDQEQLKPKIVPKTERGIRQAEIVVEDFHGLGPVKARDYLSEANRNGLGLSIYFAGLLKRAPILRTLVLDDITHSSDNIHRRGLSSFIVTELASAFQLIVLTHDQHWHDRLMSTLPSDKSISITVVDWSPDGLTYKTDKWSSLLDRAATKIKSFDHTGGNTLRQALEKFMNEICEQLNILFPFRQSTNQISLNDKRQQLQKAIKDSWATGSGIIDPNTPAVALLLNSQRITNLTSHYGSYDSWDPQDLLDVLKDVEDLLNLFICKNSIGGTICGGLLFSLRKVNGAPPVCKRCKNPIVL